MQNINNLCMGCMKDNGGESVCHYCGYSKSNLQSAPLLPLRTLVDDRYVVGKVIEQNGEGVTYIGWDSVLQSAVRIREFLPENLCSRIDGAEFITVEHGCEALFEGYMKEFLELARSLARNRELNSLFTVYDIIESNGTAYYISENVECITLEDFLNRNGGTLTWDQARVLMIPALSTISALHNSKIIHGGISPKTLVVCRDGKLRITGFCIPSVRSTGGDIPTEIYPGYAAVEQYGFDKKPVSDATDNYAFAACIYRALIGNQPPEATTRISNDKMIIPAKIAETIPGYVLDTMAEALQIMPEDRISSTDKLKSKLSNQPVVNNDAKKVSHTSDSSKAAANDSKGKSHAFAYAMFALIITVAIALIILIVFFGKTLSGNENSSSSSDDSSIISSVDISSDDQSSSTSQPLAGEIDIVPNVQNVALNTAKGLPESADFDFVIIAKEYDDSHPAGTIISQDPSYGTQLPKINGGAEKNVINVVISLGSEDTTVPSLKGMTEEKARLELLKLGFSNDNIIVGEERYSTEVPYGMVVDFEPALDKNEKISKESVITLHLNSNTTAVSE